MIRKSNRHSKFDKSVAEFAKKYPSITEAVLGLAWSLERDPKLGIRIQEIDVWRVRLRLEDSSQFLIYYSFDSKTVRLLTIALAD